MSAIELNPPFGCPIIHVKLHTNQKKIYGDFTVMINSAQRHAWEEKVMDYRKKGECGAEYCRSKILPLLNKDKGKIHTFLTKNNAKITGITCVEESNIIHLSCCYDDNVSMLENYKKAVDIICDVLNELAVKKPNIANLYHDIDVIDDTKPFLEKELAEKFL